MELAPGIGKQLPLKNNAALSRPVRIILLCFILFFSFSIAPVAAKHLVGGSVTYKYLGIFNGLYRYRITADVFRDCLDPAAPMLEDSIAMAFYEKVADRNGDTVLTKTLEMQRTSLEPVDAVAGGSKCSFKPTTCLQHGIYIGVVNLNPSKYGYYMQYLRCCRNDIQNIPSNTGYNYWGFISPTNYQNTSPSFNDVPVPYVCVQDTITLNFSASEPDGDVIHYRLAVPYEGAVNGNPAPGPPLTYSDPLPVNYNRFAGYDFNHPFGPGGYCKIDSTSGLLKVYMNSVGRFVIAVDYIEFRNGKQINRTRRDVQFIVISCPKNPAPVRVNINGSAPTDYYIEGGNKLDVSLMYSDPNYDSVSLTAAGSILQRKTNPAVLKVINGSDPSVITGNIVWQTTCSDISPNPYNILVKAQDHGCPPKNKLQSINLYVQPPVISTGISGPATACGIKDTFTYSAAAGSGYSLAWKVDGGKIISNKGNSIKVLWYASTSGTIKVVAKNAFGCIGDTVSLPVKIFLNPVVSIFSGPVEVCVNKVVSYTISGAANAAVIWKYGNAKVSNINGRFLNISWPDTGYQVVDVVVRDTNGCQTDTLKKKVYVSKPTAHSIYGPNSVCPNAKGIDYYSDNQKGSTYNWIVSGGIQTDGGNTAHIKVNWGNKGSGSIKVIETTTAGCVGDTITITVIIDYKLVSPAIRGDSSVCENTQSKVYQVLNIHNSTFTWTLTNGMIMSGQGTYSIIVQWGAAGKGKIAVQQTAYDSVNNESCIAAPVFLNINIDSTPLTTPINGDTIGCINTLHTYRVTGLKNSSFTWLLNDSSQKINNQGRDSISIYFNKPGHYVLKVQEMSKDSCPGIIQTKKIFIDSMPNTGDIKGPSAICPPHFKSNIYNVTGRPKSVFQWTIDGGIINTGQGTSSINVDWLRAGTGKINVTETSVYGCPGPEKTLEVKIDSLKLVMDLVTTSRANDNQVEVHWHTENSEFLSGPINIFRSSFPNHDGYRMIGSVPPYQKYYIDKNVNTHALSYYYKIEALNTCLDTISSAIHRTILLQNNPPEDSIVGLKWNPYLGWAGGPDQYTIYKTVNDDTTLNGYAFTHDTGTIVFTDLIGYRQCFRIAARKRSNPPLISWSNDICVDINPVLWIPNAFTPNNDNTNNTWRVVATNYKSFKADIYNRWGEHIFSSDNPSHQWDGTYKGKICPEGVYLYMITVGGVRDNIYRNGTVNLLR
jgi:gliding motility-associated-like protein